MKGNVQALVWDFTIDHPGDSINNQVFYKRNLPAKALPPTHLKISGLKPGKYTLSIYKTGYQANDPYTAYFKMGSPSQLTIDQAKSLKQNDSDNPIEKLVVNISSSCNFDKQLNIRQNDVLLIKLTKVN